MPTPPKRLEQRGRFLNPEAVGHSEVDDRGGHGDQGEGDERGETDEDRAQDDGRHREGSRGAQDTSELTAAHPELAGDGSVAPSQEGQLQPRPRRGAESQAHRAEAQSARVGPGALRQRAQGSWQVADGVKPGQAGAVQDHSVELEHEHDAHYAGNRHPGGGHGRWGSGVACRVERALEQPGGSGGQQAQAVGAQDVPHQAGVVGAEAAALSSEPGHRRAQDRSNGTPTGQGCGRCSFEEPPIDHRQ